MRIKLARLKETRGGERRVAIAPTVVGAVSRLGGQVFAQSVAGYAVELPDGAIGNAETDVDAAPEAWPSTRSERRIGPPRRGGVHSTVMTRVGPRETAVASDGH